MSEILSLKRKPYLIVVWSQIPLKTNNFIDKKKIRYTLKPLGIPFFKALDAKSQCTAKDPDAGKDEGKRRRGQQRVRLWVGIIEPMDMSLSKLQGLGSLVCCSPWDHKELDSTEWLNNNSLGHSTAQLESGQNVFSIGCWQHPHEAGIFIFIVKVKNLRPCCWGAEKWGWDLTPLVLSTSSRPASCSMGPSQGLCWISDETRFQFSRNLMEISHA